MTRMLELDVSSSVASSSNLTHALTYFSNLSSTCGFALGSYSFRSRSCRLSDVNYSCISVLKFGIGAFDVDSMFSISFFTSIFLSLRSLFRELNFSLPICADNCVMFFDLSSLSSFSRT